jgi:hypothetical protein
MDFSGDQWRCRPIFTLGLAVAVLLLAFPAPGASASQAISSATAVSVPAPAAATASASEGMSLEFTSKVARVVGPGALVKVKCSGSEAPGCVGTLAIYAPGEPPEVAYSIDRGEERVVVVPLGSQRDLFDGIVSLKTRVVAQTVQEAGGSVLTARVLRFK